jgi:glyoxylate reductase
MIRRIYRPFAFPEKPDPAILAKLRRLGARFEKELTPGTEAVATLLRVRVDAEFFDRAPGVRIVALVAVGYDNVDVPEATRRGVLITNTPDVLTEATADVAWSLLLSAARRVAEGDRYVRAGRFTKWDWTGFRGADVHGRTLGIVGAGRIGQAVARRGLGFAMKVLYAARSPKRDFERETGARRATLEKVLRESDFVSINVPLNAETRHLIGARELSLMKRTAILVNTARGPIVDEAALARALKARRIAAAGLDVYEKEPEVHPGLLGLDNVTLLPHIGSSTDSTRRAMYETALRNVLAYLSGRVPPNVVNARALGLGPPGSPLRPRGGGSGRRSSPR